MDNANETAREILENVLQTMEDRGIQTYMVGLNKKEIEYLLDAVNMTWDQPWTYQAYKGAYDSGFQRGYQTAVLDMGKRIKEMRTFGGDKQEKRVDGMPEHHAGRTADMQRKLQRAGTEAGDGGSLGAMPAEGGHT